MEQVHNCEPAMWLTRKQTAAHMGVSTGTLANWASMDIGPTYAKVGARRVMYRMVDVDAWMAARLQKRDA
jgi:predicted DNA-binding transcriptional regulator AlpA